MKAILTIIILSVYLILAETALELHNIDLASFQSNQGFNINVGFGAGSVTPAGDINNDGLQDTIISSPATPGPSGSGLGRVYIIFGRSDGSYPDVDLSTWDTTKGIMITGVPTTLGGRLGFQAGYAGDMNKDQVDDIYVSAIGDSTVPGVVYIIFGSSGLNGVINVATMSSNRGIKIIGAHAGDVFGNACSRLGDVNGDGIDDLGIGAYTADSNRGVAYIIFGKHLLNSDLTVSSSLSLSGKGIQIWNEGTATSFGFTVKAGGDINGDGINDIIIGCPYISSSAGRLYLIFGSHSLNSDIYTATMMNTQGIKIMGSSANLLVGYFASGCDDFNGDGKNDIAIPVPTKDNNIGGVYVAFGKNGAWSNINLGTFSSADGIIIRGKVTPELAGYSIAFADINKDGIADLLVGAPLASPFSRSSAGSVYVILGRSQLTDVLLDSFNADKGIVINGAANSGIGYTLMKVGDLDGDDQDDSAITGLSKTALLYTSSLQINPPAVNRDNKDSDQGIDRIVDFEVTAGAIIAITTSGLQMNQSGIMAVMTGVLLAKQLQFIRYIDVEYSRRLMLTFQKQPYNLVTVNFGPLFPKSLEGEAFRHPASPRFARYINRLLVVNLWRGLTTFGILLIVLCAAFILRKIPIKNPTLKLVRDKLQSFIFLNYMFSFILSNTDNIILFSIVEYKSFKLDGGLATASFIISIFCLLVLLGILVFIPWHLYRLRKRSKYQTKEEKLQACDSSRVLFEEVKDKYFIQQLYLFILCFRVVLHNIIIGALEAPILQASLLIVLNILMVTYIVTLLPHQKMITNIEVVGYEIMIFIANVTCLHIATLDPSDQPNALVASDVILVSNIIVIAFSMLISALKVILKVLPIIKEKLAARKKKPEQTQPTPLTMISPTEDGSPRSKSPSPCKTPKHIEVEEGSLMTVAEEDIEAFKIETKKTKILSALDTLGKEESNREFLESELAI